MRLKALEVPPHARKRYRQWIDPDAKDEQIVEALRDAMRGATRLFSQTDYRAHYAVHGGSYRLVVRHAPGHAPAVITVLPGISHPTVPDEDPYDRLLDTPEPPAPVAKLVADAKLPAARSGASPLSEFSTREREAIHHLAQRLVSDSIRKQMEEKYGARLHDAEAHGRDENSAKVRAWRLLLQVYPQIDSPDLRDAIRSALPPDWMLTEGYGVRAPLLTVEIVSRFLRHGTVVEVPRNALRLYHPRHEAWLRAVDLDFDTFNGTLAEELLPRLVDAIAAGNAMREQPSMASLLRTLDHMMPALRSLRTAAEAWPDAIVRVAR